MLSYAIYGTLRLTDCRCPKSGPSPQAIKKELADMHATAHRDTDRRGKKLADLHSDIEHVHKTASGGDISCLLKN